MAGEAARVVAERSPVAHEIAAGAAVVGPGGVQGAVHCAGAVSDHRQRRGGAR